MSDVEVGAVAAATGGTDQLKPAAKKQRKLTEADLGGPIEDEETAREKLEDLGFDPDNIKEALFVRCPDGDGHWYVNPMCHFAGWGDLRMCRYLVTRGASTTDGAIDGDGDVIWFPMLAAARNGMTKAVKWLYNHGARGDIRKTKYGGDSPLRSALFPWVTLGGDENTAQWLILHGAIPSDEDGNLDESFMENAFTLRTFWEAQPEHEPFRERKRLLQWAEGIRDDYDRFTTFLQGTWSRATKGSDHAPPSRCLGGYEGVRKLIADYVGVMTGQKLRTVRQIIGPLQKALSDADARRRQK